MSAAVQPASRGPFDGVLQIVRYNWNLYATAILGAVAVVALVMLLRPPAVVAWILMAGAVLGIFWLAASLAVSFYVYDLSNLYHWEWIRDVLELRPHDAINVHVGLDETSVALRRLYPDSQVAILDVYDPKEMPEASIARARLEGRSVPGTVRADFRALPIAGRSVDAVFVIFAAHELRHPAAKEAFFKEAHRVLQPGGYLLLVEHVRDAWNLAAFGPGAFHFFPRAEWLRVAASSGFEMRRELLRTVFVHAFVFRRR